jgi:hypothetical protein
MRPVCALFKAHFLKRGVYVTETQSTSGFFIQWHRFYSILCKADRDGADKQTEFDHLFALVDNDSKLPLVF